jgi:tetratricopeptide (TPR) repeat protein
LIANQYDQLLGKVLLERGLVAEGDLRRLYAESNHLQSNGNSVSLGQLLVHNRLLDANYCRGLEQELAQSGRSCGRCQQVFMKHPTAPEYCPGCQLPISRIAPMLGQHSPNTSTNIGSLTSQSAAYSPPLSGSFRQSANYSSGANVGIPVSGSFRMNQPSGAVPVVPAGLRRPSGPMHAVPAAVPVIGMSAQQAAMMSGKFRVPVNGLQGQDTTSTGTALPPSTRPDSKPEGLPNFGKKLSSGSHFCGHEILSELGRGGMGVVYKARNESNGDIVALKVLLAGEFASKKIIKRFKDEISVLCQLDHPNIIPIRTSGAEQGLNFFTMAYVEGCGLDKLIKERKVSMRRGLEIVATVCEAIHQAHEIGIVHRDLKPGNVMVDKDGIPYVMDFGLAKDLEANHSMTRSGVPIGTPYYMPPEQAKGDHRNLDERADIYALGAVLYEIITHRVPFKASTTTELMRMIIEEEPTPPRQLRPHCTPEYEAIALKSLAKDADDRYDTALDMADDIHSALAGKPIKARTGGLVSSAKRFLKRNKRAAGICLGTVIVAAVTGLFFHDRHVNQEKANKAFKAQQEAENAAKKVRKRQEREKRLRDAEDKEKRQAVEKRLRDRAKEAKLLAKLNNLRSSIEGHLDRARSCRKFNDWRTHMLRAQRDADELFTEAGKSAKARDFFQRGKIRQALGKFKGSYSDYRKAAESNSHKARAQFAYGFLKHLIDRDNNASCEELDKAIPAQSASRGEQELEKEAALLAKVLSQFLRNPATARTGLSALPMTPAIIESSFLTAKLHITRATATRNSADLISARAANKTCLRRNQFDYFFLTQAAAIVLKLSASRTSQQSRERISSYLRRAEQINSELPDVYQFRAVYYSQQGKKSDALMCIQRAISKARNKPHILNQLETIRNAIKNSRSRANKVTASKAPPIKSYTEFPLDRKLTENARTPQTYSIMAVRFNPIIKNQKLMIKWNAAMAALQTKKYDECLRMLDEILQIIPKHFKIRALKGSILLQQKGQIADAEDIFKQLLKEDPKNLWIQKFIARVAMLKRKYPAAARGFVEVVKKEPKDFESIYYLSNILLKLGQYKELEAVVVQYLKIWPNNFTLLGILTDVHVGLKNWRKAALYGRLQLKRKATVTSTIRTIFALAAARQLKTSDFQLLADSEKWFKGNTYVTYSVAVYQCMYASKEKGLRMLKQCAKSPQTRLKNLAERDLKAFGK